jgi:hypothetical protein
MNKNKREKLDYNSVKFFAETVDKPKATATKPKATVTKPRAKAAAKTTPKEK